MRFMVLFVLLGLASSGCVREPYTQVAPVRFSPGAPAGVTFPALVQHATALGYQLEAVDPMRGMFVVHSRMLGRVSRRRGRTYGPLRSNLFVVHVQEGEVRVTAIGRHVSEDGSMHPTLAQELEIFGDSMRRAAGVVASAMTGGGAMPAPPSAYGGGYGATAPAQGPGQPPSAYGAPPSREPPSAYGAPASPEPPSAYGGPASPEPPSAYGAPASPEPPASYGAPSQPSTSQPSPSQGTQPDSPSAPAPSSDPSPARRLGAP